MFLSFIEIPSIVIFKHKTNCLSTLTFPTSTVLFNLQKSKRFVVMFTNWDCVKEAMENEK